MWIFSWTKIWHGRGVATITANSPDMPLAMKIKMTSEHEPRDRGSLLKHSWRQRQLQRVAASYLTEARVA